MDTYPKLLICPPFQHTTLKQKQGGWGGGGGAFVWILISSCAYAPPVIPNTIVTTAAAIWMYGSFYECVLQEINGTCVKTNPRGNKATCIISDNRGWTPCKLAFLVRAPKTLTVASKRAYSIFVCACSQTQSTMDLNQIKSSLKHTEKMLNTGRLHARKIPM